MWVDCTCWYHAYQSRKPINLCYFTLLRAILYIPYRQGLVGGDKGILHIERGKGACANWTARRAGPKWEGGRLTGGDGGRADKNGKIFSSGRWFASLGRDIPGRDGGSDGKRRNWSGSACSTSGTAKTGVWNCHFAGWSRVRWIVESSRKRGSQKDFTRGKLADFVWRRRRRQALSVAASLFLTARRSTLLSKSSSSTARTSSYFSWWLGNGGGMLWGAILPPAMPRL